MTEAVRYLFAISLGLLLLALYWELLAANESSKDAGNVLKRSKRLRILSEIFSISEGAALGFSLLICFVVPFFLMFWRVPVGVLAVVGGIGAFALIPWWGPKFLANRASAKFEEQLPAFVDLMVSAVRGNLPLPLALSHAVPSLQEPLKSEISRLSTEALSGRGGMSAAIENARKRHPSRNYSMLLAVLGVFSARGGNLVEPVQTMAKSFKEIHRLYIKLKTATAAARSSFWMINGAMLFIIVIVSALSPDLLDMTFQSFLGGVLFFIGLLIWAFGAYLLRLLTKVEI
ncbi:type II secretion system F family protein [Rhizobium sp. L1K21]|uniref:type II secretion system F family protein n=1 Tax=Rhizobium sp. L1K21 TaxID=2954933 RepID=UPI002092CAAF|nr:type II secretion system F family protein [Rhizobium sp. L1K21]MCO6188235.1 type II secretion system F family protein [Rhizobium sp. L1K21]